MMIKFSHFKNKFDKDEKPLEMSWDHLCSKISKHDIRDDKDGVLISPAIYVSELPKGSKLDGYEFHSKTYSNGTPNPKAGEHKAKIWITPSGDKLITGLDGEIIRRNCNVKLISMCVLDFDKGMHPETLVEKCKDFNFALHSTFSNTKENPKFRLVIPFAEPIDVKTFTSCWPFGFEGVDKSCKDPCRMFYAPSCPQKYESVSFVHTETAKKFFVVKDSKKGKDKPRLKKMDFTSLDAILWFQIHGAYIKETGQTGKHWVRCPWFQNHTNAKQGDTDSVLWNDPDKWPTFSCSHNSCSNKTIKDVMTLWGDANEYCSKELKLSDLKVKTEIKALGYDGDNCYYYQCNLTSHIVPLRPAEHRELNFYSITSDMLYWLKNYGDEETGKIAWKISAADMMGRCHKVGFFHPEMIRGGGVWRDSGRIVAHLGDKLVVDGKDTPVIGFQSKFIYEAMVHQVKSVKALPLDDMQKVGALIKRFPFSSENDALLLCGMVVCGMLSGILTWRPHLWITGDQSSGKSSILTHILNPMWAPIGGIFSEGKTTDAGIRQKLRRNAYPVVIDESESDNKNESDRVEGIIQMIRSASSDSESRVYKGSISGKAVEFVVKSCFVLCSISHGLERAQDKQRFTILSCTMTKTHIDEWGQLSVDLKKTLTPDYALGFYAHIIENAEIILKSIEIMKNAIIAKVKGSDTRIGYQVGSLLAAVFYLRSGRIPAQDEAEAMAFAMLNAPQMEREDTSVPQQTLNYLLSYMLPLDGGERRTVGEMVQEIIQDQIEDSHKMNKSLQRHGIRLKEKVLWVSSNHPQTIKIFREGGIKGHFGLLSHLPNVEKKVIRFSGYGTCRAIGVKVEPEKSTQENLIVNW